MLSNPIEAVVGPIHVDESIYNRPATARIPPAMAPITGTWDGTAKPVLVAVEEAAEAADDAPEDATDDALLETLETAELAAELRLERTEDSRDKAEEASEPVVSEARDWVTLATALVSEASMLLRSEATLDATEDATLDKALWPRELACEAREEAMDSSWALATALSAVTNRIWKRMVMVWGGISLGDESW